VQSIIDQIKEEGGRFLRPAKDGTWEEVSDDVASKKIIHDFRTVRKKKLLLEQDISETGTRKRLVDSAIQIQGRTKRK
jgi:hypothetical protein